ncbi:MAG: Trimethylamine methyltransferase, partial [Chloroflexota bacterium]|nr:Trimethylamine methyltransferase [Chloroflexota bacterium]
MNAPRAAARLPPPESCFKLDNLLMHGAGWMEGGLHAGYEKVIIDA